MAESLSGSDDPEEPLRKSAELKNIKDANAGIQQQIITTDRSANVLAQQRWFNVSI